MNFNWLERLSDQLRPNFLFVVGMITLITFQVVGWVDFGAELVIKHPETGSAYVNGTVTLVLSVMTLVLGGMIGILGKLLDVPPPPEMTEDTVIKILDKFSEEFGRLRKRK